MIKTTEMDIEQIKEDEFKIETNITLELEQLCKELEKEISND